jgi:hypothetical protein
VEEFVEDVYKEQQDEENRYRHAHAASDLSPCRVGDFRKFEQHERRDNHRQELRVIFGALPIKFLFGAQEGAKEEGEAKYKERI